MSENKTRPTNASVSDFINAVENDTRRKDAHVLLGIMEELTGEPAVMWGNSIIGFGRYHYKYDSGREGDMILTGFSPRKSNLSLYVGTKAERNNMYLEKLGKHKTGSSCLYVNKLADIDLEVLKDLIKSNYEYVKKKYNG
jgi:hypothetical protein